MKNKIKITRFDVTLVAEGGREFTIGRNFFRHVRDAMNESDWRHDNGCAQVDVIEIKVPED
jgi:hypothetical protein